MNARHIPLLIAVLLTTTPIALAASHTMTPTTPDHGLAAGEFYPLWSEDTDSGDSITNTPSTSEEDWYKQAVQSTDWSYTSPPTGTVEKWNNGDHAEFQPGAPNTARVPQNTPTTDNGQINDAYTRVFAVTPSTIKHTDAGTTRLIGSDGTVRVTTDYRVDIPAGDNSGDRQTDWDLERHTIEDTTLYIDGTAHDSASGTHTAELSFNDVEQADTIRVETTISTTLERAVTDEVCRTITDGDGQTYESCTDRTVSTSTTTDEVTVTDTIDVQVESLAADGTVVTTPSTPTTQYVVWSDSDWSRIGLGSGAQVTSSWRFYTQGTSDWAELTERSASGSDTVHSETYPVTVHAYPSEIAVEAENAQLDRTDTVDQPAPTLPSRITVNAAENTYSTIESFTVTTRRSAQNTVSVHGLVGNNPVQVSVAEKTRAGTETDLRVESIDPATVTVTVRVTDMDGAPVSTGQVDISGTTHQLPENGTIKTTLTRPSVSVSATYIPDESVSGELYGESTDSEALSTPLPSFDFFTRVLTAAMIWGVPLYGIVYAYQTMAGRRGDN